MKKLTILLLLAIAQFKAHAQTPVSTLHQNFDVACVVAGGLTSMGWTIYTPPVAEHGDWECTSTEGRGGTPGMECSNIVSGIMGLDTSYLLTPLLDLSSYAGHHIYLNFDTKTTTVTNGGKLAVYRTDYDDSFHVFSNDTDLSAAALPIIGNAGDSTGWVTHQLDMSDHTASGYFYIAFRFTGTNTTGGTWFLDNVNLTTTPLHITDADKQTIPLTVIGASTTNNITLSYSSVTTGAGRLAVYDMMGREVYKEDIVFNGTQAIHTINGLGLAPGMYVIKIGNDLAYSVAKVVVQ